MRARFGLHCLWMLGVGTATGVLASAEIWHMRGVRLAVVCVSVWLADRRWRGVWQQ